MKIRDLFVAHAAECKKGNKCCYSVENGSTQEFIAALEALQREALIAELEMLEPLTHQGRGTILWEMDSLATTIAARIAALKAEENYTGERDNG